jgi:hypothetical protein
MSKPVELLPYALITSIVGFVVTMAVKLFSSRERRRDVYYRAKFDALTEYALALGRYMVPCINDDKEESRIRCDFFAQTERACLFLNKEDREILCRLRKAREMISLALEGAEFTYQTYDHYRNLIEPIIYEELLRMSGTPSYPRSLRQETLSQSPEQYAQSDLNAVSDCDISESHSSEAL